MTDGFRTAAGGFFALPATGIPPHQGRGGRHPAFPAPLLQVQPARRPSADTAAAAAGNLPAPKASVKASDLLQQLKDTRAARSAAANLAGVSSFYKLPQSRYFCARLN